MQFGESQFLFCNEATYQQGVQNNRSFLRSIRMKKSLPPNDETAYCSRDDGGKPAIYLMHCTFVLGSGLQGMPISLGFGNGDDQNAGMPISL